MQPTKRSVSTTGLAIKSLLRGFPTLAARLVRETLLLVYPPMCAGCSCALDPEESVLFCPDCFIALDLISEPYCPLCGIPFAAEVTTSHLCGDCLGGVHCFDRARAKGFYQGVIREVIHRFKYGGQTFLMRPLARMLIGPAKELTRLHRVHTIVPVPLHYRRLRQRGFNQASLLARGLGSLMQIPVDYSSLKRTRWTDPQIGLSRNQRAANVKGAFSLKATAKIKGKGILLLDDVLTTGETVNQCVRVLKKDGGAREVVVLTVARTVAG
ncbi:MAG: ComF family protein [Syntrophobacterales bacterium]